MRISRGEAARGRNGGQTYGTTPPFAETNPRPNDVNHFKMPTVRAYRRRVRFRQRRSTIRKISTLMWNLN